MTNSPAPARIAIHVTVDMRQALTPGPCRYCHLSARTQDDRGHCHADCAAQAAEEAGLAAAHRELAGAAA